MRTMRNFLHQHNHLILMERELHQGGERHSFDPYGAGTSSGGAREEFERGHRSDAVGFHYTPQQYCQENMAFHQRTDNALQTLIDGQAYNT
jgi:hypothetical protein